MRSKDPGDMMGVFPKKKIGRMIKESENVGFMACHEDSRKVVHFNLNSELSSKANVRSLIMIKASEISLFCSVLQVKPLHETISLLLFLCKEPLRNLSVKPTATFPPLGTNICDFRT